MTPAFLVVFGLFVLALLALAVISVRWAVRRDRIARRTAATRRDEAAGADPGTGEAGPVRGRR